MSVTKTPPQDISLVTHIAARSVLERRLNDGWDRIEQAKQRGEEVTAWEDFWIDLLHQYEAACDALSGVKR